MILLLHILSLLFSEWRYRRKNAKWNQFSLSSPNADRQPLAERNDSNEITFDPPMYKQRYQRAVEILLDERWSSKIERIVDFGCAEFGLFIYIKNLTKASELVFVDIDELLMRDYLFKLQPLNADYLCPREKGLSVRAMVGSITHPDDCLLNVDAVIGLEIIEHIYPDILDSLPYNIFSFIRPKVVVITTPNVEFNILFDKVNKFRHPDHKFEWTKQQFQDWALNIVTRFPHYVVRFDAIGRGPLGTENLNIGCCSQLAAFIRKDLICDDYVKELSCKNSHNCNCQKCSPKFSHGVCTYNTQSQAAVNVNYTLLAHIKFPEYIDTRSEEQKLLDELKYRINLFQTLDFLNFNENRYEIPLNKMLYQSTKLLPDESHIKAFLTKFNYKLEECFIGETQNFETCLIYEADMDTGASGSDSEASGYESDRCDLDETPAIDWNETNENWEQPTNEDKSKSKTMKSELHLEVNCVEKPEDTLIDSGYNGPDDWSQSPELDFKLVNEKPKQLSNILSVFQDFDKINELDLPRKDRIYFNLTHGEAKRLMSQQIVKHPLAGPSREPVRKSKQSRKPDDSTSNYRINEIDNEISNLTHGEAKRLYELLQKNPVAGPSRVPKKFKKVSADDSKEDMKAITTCIIENSLNKIDCGEQNDFIDELISPDHEPEDVVENGDLANNNRDLEGNNCQAEEVEALDNVDHNNLNIDNEAVIVEEFVDDDADVEQAPEFHWSSREALFDDNSQVELLDDFDLDPRIEEVQSEDNIIDVDDNPVLPEEDNSFPNWLLQIFQEGAVTPEDNLQDEAHFYCQGDGIGVHLSIATVGDDEDDNESESEDESSSSSSSGSVNFASAENNSIPDLLNVEEIEQRNSLVVVGQQLIEDSANSANDDETFQSAEGSNNDLFENGASE